MTTERIPFLDLGSAYCELKVDINEALLNSLASGWYVGGPELKRFEHAFAGYVGAAHCIGVASGLDALTLALRALDIGIGDEVIVPSNTYIASWLAISHVGATPVPVEPCEDTFTINPGRIEEKITSRTRAIIPVHLYGLPADLDPILNLAHAYGLRVVEDAAQAHGARYKGQRIGAHGDAVCWSFYPGKNLGAFGDAGAVTTNESALASRIRRLGNYGSARKYVNDERGYNSRLDPIQAAVLQVKLMRLEEWTARRRARAHQYLAGLLDTGLILPIEPTWAHHVWHLYVVRTLQRDRDALHAHLSAQGINTLIHYPIPPHMQQAYADLGISADALPIARRFASEVLSLPIGPHLTETQVEVVIRVVRDFCLSQH